MKFRPHHPGTVALIRAGGDEDGPVPAAFVPALEAVNVADRGIRALLGISPRTRDPIAFARGIEPLRTGANLGRFPLLYVDTGTRALLEARLRRWPMRNVEVIVGTKPVDASGLSLADLSEKAKGIWAQGSEAWEHSIPGELVHTALHPSEWPSDIARQATNLWSETLNLPFIKPDTQLPFLGPKGAPGPVGPIRNPIPPVLKQVAEPIKQQALESAKTVAKNLWPWALGATVLGLGYLAVTHRGAHDS